MVNFSLTSKNVERVQRKEIKATSTIMDGACYVAPNVHMTLFIDLALPYVLLLVAYISIKYDLIYSTEHQSTARSPYVMSHVPYIYYEAMGKAPSRT